MHDNVYNSYMFLVKKKVRQGLGCFLLMMQENVTDKIKKEMGYKMEFS